jgi:hypothetical protein
MGRTKHWSEIMVYDTARKRIIAADKLASRGYKVVWKVDTQDCTESSTNS